MTFRYTALSLTFLVYGKIKKKIIFENIKKTSYQYNLSKDSLKSKSVFYRTMRINYDESQLQQTIDLSKQLLIFLFNSVCTFIRDAIKLFLRDLKKPRNFVIQNIGLNCYQYSSLKFTKGSWFQQIYLILINILHFFIIQKQTKRMSKLNNSKEISNFYRKLGITQYVEINFQIYPLKKFEITSYYNNQ
ncbi:hypothetical protein pb186bvf_014480 [Paramecium bursaria]